MSDDQHPRPGLTWQELDAAGETIEIVVCADGSIQINWIDGTLITIHHVSAVFFHCEDTATTELYGTLPPQEEPLQ